MDNERKYILFCKEKKTKAMWLQVLGQVMDKLNRGKRQSSCQNYLFISHNILTIYYNPLKIQYLDSSTRKLLRSDWMPKPVYWTLIISWSWLMSRTEWKEWRTWSTRSVDSCERVLSLTSTCLSDTSSCWMTCCSWPNPRVRSVTSWRRRSLWLWL